MKRGVKTLFCVLGAVALAFAAKAITGDPTSIKHGESLPASVAPAKAVDDANPYDAIVERNVFDLKDPPPTNAPVATNEPPPNVKLTGIMTIFGHKQALFMVQKSGQPGKAPEPEVSYILSEGQRQEGLEVMEIDSKAKKVKIKNDGIVSTVTFETPKAGGLGGAHRDMTPGQPHMGKAGFTPNFNPNAGGSPFPARPVRSPDFSQNSAQPGGVNPGQGGFGGGYNAGGVSAAGYNGYNQGQQQQTGLSAEEQVALALAQQQPHQDEIAAGRYPSLPPIPGMNNPQTGGQGQQEQAPSGQQPANSTPSLPPFLRPRINGQ